MKSTPAPVSVQILAFKKADRDRLAQHLGDPNSTARFRRVLIDGLQTMTDVQNHLDADDTMLLAESWASLADRLTARRETACANYANTLAVLLTSWAIQLDPSCGDIGEDEEEWEVLPVEEPSRVPEPVPA